MIKVKIRLFVNQIGAMFMREFLPLSLSFRRDIKVIVGASASRYPGWISTNISHLDISKPSDWKKFFGNNLADNLLAEHVLEHISDDDLTIALKCAYSYLKPGGIFRVAVPDGYRPDSSYRSAVMPPVDGHIQYFTLDSLSAILESAGFRVVPVEYFDSQGQFHRTDWSDEKGMVARSCKFDSQKQFAFDSLFFTSLFVDAIKADSYHPEI